MNSKNILYLNFFWYASEEGGIFQLDHFIKITGDDNIMDTVNNTLDNYMEEVFADEHAGVFLDEYLDRVKEQGYTVEYIIKDNIPEGSEIIEIEF
ncbi:hypothetical protein [Alkaliphilus sp. B6464]|uniref:hypothetical protein n=1 Tax=Alkaliphilus sp. B6464 TaxID=2731219 RepID=UPI001BA50F76|nr:hypothetical protein [Alkaliphilus sp. B6464]QUH21896.1 hypothetical protein HYG84_18340 [Alkaliphilus sp. B6464]